MANQRCGISYGGSDWTSLAVLSRNFRAGDDSTDRPSHFSLSRQTGGLFYIPTAFLKVMSGVCFGWFSWIKRRSVYSPDMYTLQSYANFYSVALSELFKVRTSSVLRVTRLKLEEGVGASTPSVKKKRSNFAGCQRRRENVERRKLFPWLATRLGKFERKMRHARLSQRSVNHKAEEVSKSQSSLPESTLSLSRVAPINKSQVRIQITPSRKLFSLRVFRTIHQKAVVCLNNVWYVILENPTVNRVWLGSIRENGKSCQLRPPPPAPPPRRLRSGLDRRIRRENRPDHSPIFPVSNETCHFKATKTFRKGFETSRS